MDPRIEHARLINRRSFMRVGTGGIGLAALWSLLGKDLTAARAGNPAFGGLDGLPHFAPKAKRVIYLYMLGAPSNLDLWDYKPRLTDLAGTDLPDSVRGGQRLTGFTANQATLPIVPSVFNFDQHGQSGQWVSELMPHTAKVVDDICFIRNDVQRADQSRPRHFAAAHRVSAGRSTDARGVGELCTRQREREPPRLHLVCLAGQCASLGRS